MSHLKLLIKLTCLVTLYDRKIHVFKNSPKWTIFGIFDELLATQNVNVARFARNVECDFFSDFQTLCGPTTPKGLLCMHNESVLSTKKF